MSIHDIDFGKFEIKIYTFHNSRYSQLFETFETYDEQRGRRDESSFIRLEDYKRLYYKRFRRKVSREVLTCSPRITKIVVQLLCINVDSALTATFEGERDISASFWELSVERGYEKGRRRKRWIGGMELSAAEMGGKDTGAA